MVNSWSRMLEQLTCDPFSLSIFKCRLACFNIRGLLQALGLNDSARAAFHPVFTVRITLTVV